MKFLRKRTVAERYGVNTRTVDRMAEDGRIPPPIYKGKFPLWDEGALDASDRAAALRRPTRREAEARDAHSTT